MGEGAYPELSKSALSSQRQYYVPSGLDALCGTETGTFRVEGYSTPLDIVRLAVELLLALYILITTLAELRDAVFGEPVGLGELKEPFTFQKMRANLWEHLSSAWNWIDAIRLGLSLSCVVGYVLSLLLP